MKVIGLDTGTTTISAVVLDLAADSVLDSRTIPNGSHLGSPNEWEHIQNADSVAERAKSVLDELLELHPDAARIGLTGQMHGMVYTDENGKSVSPLYTWQDQRAGLKREGDDPRSVVERLKEDFGLTASAGFGAATHAWHTENGSVPSQAVSFCTIPDYLGMFLTGRKRPLQHISMAASMGCFDIRKKAFEKEKLSQFGADVSLLPEVTDKFAVLGEYKGIPVTAAAGDNQASFLGSAGLEENTVLLNIGTGGQISVLVPEIVQSRDIECRPLTAGHYLAVGSSLCGGRAYAILERFFRLYAAGPGGEAEPQYDRMIAAALAEMPLADPPEALTTFNGSRSDPSLRGSILNLTEDNFTPGNLVYGVLCGICSELHQMFGQVQEKTGLTIRSLVGSGNGLRKNGILQRIASEQFGAPLVMSRYVEEAACGAAKSSVMDMEE